MQKFVYLDLASIDSFETSTIDFSKDISGSVQAADAKSKVELMKMKDRVYSFVYDINSLVLSSAHD